MNNLKFELFILKFPKMVSKKISRYVMIDKNAMILKLEENLHTTGPNVSKPNFSLVEKLYSEKISRV